MPDESPVSTSRVGIWLRRCYQPALIICSTLAKPLLGKAYTRDAYAPILYRGKPMNKVSINRKTQNPSWRMTARFIPLLGALSLILLGAPHAEAEKFTRGAEQAPLRRPTVRSSPITLSDVVMMY
jgi:hypothetical protein